MLNAESRASNQSPLTHKKSLPPCGVCRSTVPLVYSINYKRKKKALPFFPSPKVVFSVKKVTLTCALQQKMSTSTSNEVDQVQSVAMIRNLMRVTFSNVVYTRGIFDPSQFKSMNARQLLS